MTSRRAIAIVAIACSAAAFANEIAKAESAPQKLLLGDTQVEIIANYKGVDLLPKPDKTLIYNFTVPPDVVTMDWSAAGRLQRRRLQRHDEDSDLSPEALVKQVQAAFAGTLASELQKMAMRAEIGSATDEEVPPRTLIVRGEFTNINQGNKTKRMMIGFGRGASDVKAHVIVSLATAAQPIVLSEFNLNSKSGKKPGAAATMGVGSAAVGAAAGGVGDRKATVEADSARMAKAVAQQIKEAMISQKWIEVQQPEAPSVPSSSPQP
jgi:hypothetical protein